MFTKVALNLLHPTLRRHMLSHFVQEIHKSSSMFKCFAGQVHIARTGLHFVESQGLVDELIAFPLVIPVDVFC